MASTDEKPRLQGLVFDDPVEYQPDIAAYAPAAFYYWTFEAAALAMWRSWR